MSELSKEEKFYQYILNLPSDKLKEVKGDPAKVLRLYDEYPDWFMNIGQYKGKVITEKIREKGPKVMIELGGYLGYSAILFGNELNEDNEAKYYSFELNPDFAKIATHLIKLAGLEKKVEIIVGKASYTLPEFKERLLTEKKKYVALDFIFIDHWKDLYVPDLRVLESLNLIAPGTYLAADNILKPGVPQYVEYVNFSPQEKKTFNAENPNPEGKEFLGRWNILYDTKTVEVTDPEKKITDAVELTKCIDYLTG
ncbi:SPBC119.03 Probable catechol O-methyltransferase 1 [Candida maltosa Xu316]|uniref:catechol O-methyltransferase n=1 Tax=Candida maltosa (strain Xu316) TaxID=1245528 RepID=M3JZ05_CANMX|nr:S-adenosylmethionine-dependent methyltransferase, putative (Catechol o-methyltransferase, putative) [Candida maltosa Xu316]